MTCFSALWARCVVPSGQYKITGKHVQAASTLVIQREAALKQLEAENPARRTRSTPGEGAQHDRVSPARTRYDTHFSWLVRNV